VDRIGGAIPPATATFGPMIGTKSLFPYRCRMSLLKGELIIICREIEPYLPAA